MRTATAGRFSCPLCSSREIKILEIIKYKDILDIYANIVDIKRLLPQIDSDLKYLSCLSCNLNFFYPVLNADEEFYKSLQKYEWYYLEEKREYEIAGKYISENDRVLDVGCGKGAFSSLIKSKNYTGIETSQSAQALAKKNGLHIINDTIENHSLTHEFFYDVVCSFQVLEHVANPRAFLESQLRCLKPEGLLVISVPSEDSFLKYAVNCALNLPPHHLTRWTDKALSNIADILGLKLIALEHEKVQPTHKELYINSIINKLLKKEALIDFSFKRKITNRVAALLTKIISKKVPDEFLSNGLSVTAIYKKCKN